MTYVRDFTKDEAFGDYHFDISQTLTRHPQATVKNYEKTDVYVFVNFFKKKTIGEFIRVQKINFTQEEFEKLLALEK